MSFLSHVLSPLAAAALTAALTVAGPATATVGEVSAPQAGFLSSSGPSVVPGFNSDALASAPATDKTATSPADGTQKLLKLPRSMPDPVVTRSDSSLAPSLKDAGRLAPGTAIYNKRTGMRCSTGHIAGKEGHVFVVTAGHCGNTGDSFYYNSDSGRRVTFGTMRVETENTNVKGFVNSSDIGLIEITNPRAKYNSSPNLDGELAGWISNEEVERTRPTICRLGSTTGFSCGNYLGINREVGGFYFANHAAKGDSGGAVYALVDGKYYAAGVYSAYIEEVDSMHLAMEVGTTLNQHGLSLYN